jgi:hypothetical protein
MKKYLLPLLACGVALTATGFSETKKTFTKTEPGTVTYSDHCDLLAEVATYIESDISRHGKEITFSFVAVAEAVGEGESDGRLGIVVDRSAAAEVVVLTMNGGQVKTDTLTRDQLKTLRRGDPITVTTKTTKKS